VDALPKISPAQSLLLRTVARNPDGRVIPPDTLRGGARVKVLTALLQRQRPVPPDDVQPVDTTNDLQLLEGIPVRSGTKLAALVIALRRPQGATSLQLMLATGWQPHTVRGAISGMLRKKLGLNVVLAQNESGERVYRVI
jgi:Protein of unknown function (DUF3489)